MKRELEFRVWDNDDKKYMTLDDYEKMGCVMLNNDGTLYLSSDYRFVLNMMIKLDKYVVEQYTGLKDKNGVKIFEGDIVMFDYEWTKPNEIGVITWNKDNASFQIKGHIPSSSMKHLNRMKVIGNIHEDNKGSESYDNNKN